MEWVRQYIGIPYLSRTEPDYGITGGDCYYLARRVIREQIGLEMPSMSDHYSDSDDMDDTANAVVHGMSIFQEVETPQPFDIVVLRILGKPVHVGIYAGNNKMLHTMRGHMSALEPVTGMKWRNRIEGYFRWTPNKA